MVGAADHPEQRALAEAQAGQHLGPFDRVLDRRRLRLQLHAHADRLDVLAGVGQLGAHHRFELGDPVEVVLTDVDHSEDASVGQQEVRGQGRPMVSVEPGPVEGAAIGQRVVGGLERGQLVAERAVELGLALHLGEPLLDRLEVGQGQLQLQDAQVLQRVGRPRHVVVDEGAQDEDDGVDLADVGEEAVAEAFALAGAFDQAADVDDLDGGVHDVAAGRHLGQPVESLVRHLGDADVGVLGGEGVGGGQGATARQRVVERALAGVGEADQAESLHRPAEAIERRRPWPGRRPARPGPARRRRDSPCAAPPSAAPC